MRTCPVDFHVLLIEEFQNIQKQSVYKTYKHIKIVNSFKEEMQKILFKA